MTKIRIYVGPSQSGKTKAARKVASLYEENESIFYYPKSIGEIKNIRSTVFFKQCNENTKLLVFEEIAGPQKLESFYDIIINGIEVFKKYNSKPFVIYPEIIVICQNNQKRSDFKNIKDFDVFFEIVRFPVNPKPNK